MANIHLFRRLGHRLEDLRGTIVGYKAGSEPAWEQLMAFTLRVVWAHESDQDALALVRGQVRNDPDTARHTLERLLETAPSYESDRAARLVSAALKDGAIEPADADKRDLFAQESALGRESVTEAFRQLVAREPHLEGVRRRLEDTYARLSNPGDTRLQESGDFAIRRVRLDAMREVASKIGPRSSHGDPLLRSALARNISFRILELASGNPRGFNANASYFAADDTTKAGLPTE